MKIFEIRKYRRRSLAQPDTHIMNTYEGEPTQTIVVRKGEFESPQVLGVELWAEVMLL